MTEKQLKKLSRAELLEILIQQAKRNDSLEAELAELKTFYEEKISEYEALLERKTIAIEESGSIAEASLKLSGIFEAAQQAADIYLENIRTIEKETEERCRTMQEEAKKICIQKIRKAGNASKSSKQQRNYQNE